MKYVSIKDIISITDKTLTTNLSKRFSTFPFLSSFFAEVLIAAFPLFESFNRVNFFTINYCTYRGYEHASTTNPGKIVVMLERESTGSVSQ